MAATESKGGAEESVEATAEVAQECETRLRRGADEYPLDEVPVAKVRKVASVAALLDPGTGRGNH